MNEKNIQGLGSKKILGMPVYSCKEGLNLGNIKQILVDNNNYSIQGFLLEKRKMTQYERILPFSAVHNFGDDGVTVESISLLERRGQNSKYVRAIHHPLKIIGSRVFTSGGKTLGKIEEYRFDSQKGDISSLEISPDGFFKVRSLVKGEYIIAISGHTTMLKDEAIDDAVDMENAFITNVGNAADTVREKAEEFINNTSDITKRFSANVSERIERIKKRDDEIILEDAPNPSEELINTSDPDDVDNENLIQTESAQSTIEDESLADFTKLDNDDLLMDTHTEIASDMNDDEEAITKSDEINKNKNQK